MAKDYYKILGVEKDASHADIKKAFRKRAHEYHPDKKGGDEKKFKEASEAYATLGDEKKRAQYDMTGGNAAGGAGGFGGGAGGFDFSNFGGFGGQGGGQHFEFDLGDIFGGGFGGGTKQRRGRDIQMDLEITLSEALLGVEKKLTVNKVSECKSCQGTGGKGGDTATCGTCHGSGRVQRAQRTPMGTFNMQAACPECDGVGQIIKQKCPECSGAGSYKQATDIEVKVPAGIQSGQGIQLHGAGEPMRGGTPGDLIVRIHVDVPNKLNKKQQEAIENLRKVGL